jgi:hypothetical protein
MAEAIAALRRGAISVRPLQAWHARAGVGSARPAP